MEEVTFSACALTYHAMSALSQCNPVLTNIFKALQDHTYILNQSFAYNIGHWTST